MSERYPVPGDYVLVFEPSSSKIFAAAYVCKKGQRCTTVGMRWIEPDAVYDHYPLSERGLTWCLSGGEEEAAFAVAQALR